MVNINKAIKTRRFTERRIMKDKTAKLISWTVILTIGILFWYAVIKRVMEVM